MNYLDRDLILDVNKTQIEKYGGNHIPPFNLNNSNSFDYLVEHAQNELYNPTVVHVASVYIYHTIDGHVFHDGNKRTALFSAMKFLNLNDYRFNRSLSILELFQFVTKYADDAENVLTFDDCFADVSEMISVMD